MKILSIETSCDETACAVVEDGVKVLSNVIYSQADLHAETGGVVPEVAAREHILKIIPVVDGALKKAKCDWDDIDAIAVTKGPGLISSLIIGTETASVMAMIKNKPIIPVHHIAGHIYANFLGGSGETGADAESGPEFPILILTVSGGHNEIIYMKKHNEFSIVGETRDDAAGEAFDKVARILGLGYPGGPAISKAGEKGDREAFKLPRSYLEKDSLDFSFSGLKTAVLTQVKEYLRKKGVDFSSDDFRTISTKIPTKFKNDLAASFQEAVVDVLTDKLLQAAMTFKKTKEIHLAGGVSANSRLREMITHKLQILEEKGGKSIRLRYPADLSYCTDNAAMIAAAGYFIYQSDPKKIKKGQNITPTTSFDLF